jgi:hypothetical protein
MTTHSLPTRHRPDLSVETKASAYDKLNAALIAVILLVGFLVAALFLIWLTTAFDFSSQKKAIDLGRVDEAGNEKPEGEADDVLEPGVEEFPEVETPQLANALEAVTNAVSSVRASLEERSGMAAEMGRGSGFGSREGGPGTGGGAIPEYKRWIIQYESDSLDTYAKQLDFFSIDIGVLHKTNKKIWRINQLSAQPTVSPSSQEAEDKTLRFMHKKQKMRRWDQTLATRGGAPLDNAITCQFYPEPTRQIIRNVEGAALADAGRKVKDVRNTILKLEDGPNGFTFTVVDLLYR